MEIRISLSLDRVDPPAGRLGPVAEQAPAGDPEPPEVPFTGWLGLLRALYEVVGAPDGPPPDAA